MLLAPDPTGSLRLDHLQQREDHWVIVDLIGNGGHGRMVPVPDWDRKMIEIHRGIQEIAAARSTTVIRALSFPGRRSKSCGRGQCRHSLLSRAAPGR
jgi:hypothetical protein